MASTSGSGRDARRDATPPPADRHEDHIHADEDEDHIHTEPLDPEAPAVGVEDVVEFFDREPPEHPTSESDAQPPFG